MVGWARDPQIPTEGCAVTDRGGQTRTTAGKEDLAVSMARANVVGALLVLPPVLALYLA